MRLDIANVHMRGGGVYAVSANHGRESEALTKTVAFQIQTDGNIGSKGTLGEDTDLFSGTLFSIDHFLTILTVG